MARETSDDAFLVYLLDNIRKDLDIMEDSLARQDKIDKKIHKSFDYMRRLL